MSLTYGFFNSVSGDRTYNADDMSEYFEGLISNGVFDNIDNRMIVTAGTGMTVNVGTGRAIIKNRWARIKSAPEQLSIGAASAQYNRLDAVVLRYTAAARTVELAVKRGTNAAQTPAAPTMTRTDAVFELCLAYVYVPKNLTAITQSRITDTRARTDICGFVTGLIEQVDTNDLFEQYDAYCTEKTAEIDAYFAAKQTEFNNWFSSLTSTLNVDTEVVKYQHTEYVSAETSQINIGITQYAAGDILLVHVGGVLFVEGSEFTISGTGANAKIILTNTLRPDNYVTFICIKSVVGSNIISMNGSNVNVADETLTITTEG